MRYTDEIIFLLFVIRGKHKNNKKAPKLKLNARDGCGEKLQKNHTTTTKNTGRIKIREMLKITRRDMKKMHDSEQKD